MKVGLLKRICDQAAEVDCNKELIFFNCIINHEILCQGVLDMKHVVAPIVKIVNFIQLKVSIWLSDLAFALDIFWHMEELNTKLQGNDVFSHQMYYVMMALQVKLKLFSRQLSQ
ncbi:hypothetical protein RF11_11516 [Thelohanellus kitauei]|uniref:Uncharacterized protein n=1 Tax=Thelohanellus kitauei TaxID=669202 RepID=A0A0C2N4Z0_THEKT|nr:hypothetical protein RF11_11516 [Thelohanellus kitauei]